MIFYISETETTETKLIYTLALNFKKDRYVSARELCEMDVK